MTNLTSIAATMTTNTKVAAKSSLKSAGIKQSLADQVLTELTRITKARAARKSDLTKWARNGRVGRKLAAGATVARLQSIRCNAVDACLSRAVRIGTNDTIDVALTSNPAIIGLTQRAEVSWDQYKGKFKGYAMYYKANTITVPTDWRVRVQRRGLDIVDGMMTLDASPLESTGCELFAASWLVQRRGNNAETVRGYIARSGTVTFHGATADQALTGIARKIKMLAFTASLSAADLGGLVAKCASVHVSVGDARATGACEYGIRSWLNSVGLDYDAGATLGEVYQAYQREPRPEARATILRVVRRQRSLVTA